MTLHDGEIRQIQFIEDDSLMVLWTSKSRTSLCLTHSPLTHSRLTTEGSSYLLNLPFQPTSPDGVGPSTVTYTDCDTTATTAIPPPTSLDMLVPSSSTGGAGIKHRFAAGGVKAKPARIDVNGRQGRRAICVMYGDGLRYEVLDLDAEVEEDEME